MQSLRYRFHNRDTGSARASRLRVVMHQRVNLPRWYSHLVEQCGKLAVWYTLANAALCARAHGNWSVG